MKKKLILAIILFLFLFGIYWIYSHSFIEVTIENGTVAEASYSLKPQGPDKANEGASKSSTFKLLVAKSSYEVAVQQSGRTYFAVIKTGPFLSTSKVTAKLVEEKSREFVGDNPSSCIGYLKPVLVSYACTDINSNINIHKPATSSQPTYTIKPPVLNTFGTVEGIISTNDGDVMMLKSPEDRDEAFKIPAGHFAHIVNESLESISSTNLKNLSADKTYLIKAKGGGFIAYDNNLQQAFDYASVKSEPVAYKLEQPNEQGLEPVDLSIVGNNLLTLFSKSDDAEEKRSEIIVSLGGATKHFVFDKNYSSAALCGNDKACLVGDDGLEVYAITNEKAKQLFAISNVASIENSQGNLLVANKTGILNFNVENQTGYYEYTLGDYRLSGMQAVDSGYVLRLTNNVGRGVAVFINQNGVNSDNIDKKVAELQKTPEAAFVSIYGKYIYISAELGQPIYDAEAGSYNYNPEIQKAAANKINLEIDRIGIDRKAYSISSNAF